MTGKHGKFETVTYIRHTDMYRYINHLNNLYRLGYQVVCRKRGAVVLAIENDREIDKVYILYLPREGGMSMDREKARTILDLWEALTGEEWCYVAGGPHKGYYTGSKWYNTIEDAARAVIAVIIEKLKEV